MKKILMFVIFLFASVIQAQNVDYYGNGLRHSDSLQIAVNDSISGEYIVMDKIMYFQVDSNWTASNLAILVHNEYEDTWELLQDEDGTIIEYTITQGRTTTAVPIKVAGAKKIKFVKMTSGAYVTQLTTASTVILHTIRY